LSRRAIAHALISIFGVLCLLVSISQSAGQQASVDLPLFRAPAKDRPTRINFGAETVLPNGRLITPRGTQVKVAPHPYGLALTPDGKTLVTANGGTSPFSASIITDLDSATPQVTQIPPAAPTDADDDLESVWMGTAIAPDNRTLFLSEGENGRIGVFNLGTRKRIHTISLDQKYRGRVYGNSLVGDLKLSPDGRTLFALDLAHFELVVIDVEKFEVLSRIRVGRMPFGLAVAQDGSRVYVTNVGMFEYELVPGFDSNNVRETGLDFPPFGFPSREATEGTTIDGKHIRGLGDPNVPESNSLWVIGVSRPALPQVTAKIRTGIPVGKMSVGGSSPGAVVAGSQYIYVSNAAQDSITILDAHTLHSRKTVLLEPAPSLRGLRGVLPFGMALSSDQRRLYVACSGINAIAVLDGETGEVLGYIPTAWFPARVVVSPNGRTLYVACAKGLGAGPNGGKDFHPGPEGTYIGDITKGMVSILSVPSSRELEETTAQVLRNNGFVEVPPGNKPSALQQTPPETAMNKIKHVVFIVKENRTFDEVFGDLAGQGEDVAGDPSLARWGENTSVEEKGQPIIEKVDVTPNHHALARRFAFSDNFYVDADVSTDGHHWLVGNYPNEVVETTWPTAYGHKFHFRADSDAPGRVGIGAANSWPESFLEAGSLWEHLARHGISFRNYGEGFDLAGEDEGPGFLPTGIRNATNMPIPEVLFENTSRDYATFNTNISDQYRFEQFRREFNIRYASRKEPLPSFIYIWLPNDHTAEPRPGDGFAYRASYVADNDLALGKLVELFSNSPYWKDTAIFVTEDDAQDGVDHVDAHRSLLMLISPFARRGVTHDHTSIASILKTFDLIFGLPPLNQYDAVSTDLSDMFTSKPDFRPWQALPSDLRIFDPRKVREPGADLKSGTVPFGESLDDPAAIRRQMRDQSRKSH